MDIRVKPLSIGCANLFGLPQDDVIICEQV